MHFSNENVQFDGIFNAEVTEPGDFEMGNQLP